MKKYLLTLAALSLVLTSAARKPKNARMQTAAKNSEAAIADSLLAVTARQASLIDSLRSLVVAEHTAGELSGDRNEAEETEEAVVSPEQAAADSVAALQLRLRPTKIESIFDTNGLTVIDTLATDNDAVQVILYSNNSWKYVRNREIAKDSTIFEKYWDTTTLFPYREVDMSGMPKSVVIDLVDSLTCYHCPYQGTVHPHGKYGPRRRRQHQGVDLPLKTGDPVYATFCGRVRISQYNKGGYGNLVIIRHDNGLETYYGQSFDPERLIDFKNGTLSRETFLLKKSFFSIYSNAGQDFEDEIANEEQDKKEAAEKAAMKYYKIRSGDTLGAIARRHGTTVANLCRLNGIKSTTILRIGRSLRVR